ncbi:MAG: class I SAM-dependent methyltransferase [Planctomycetia bacterium]|nr:class I SAM-dependent methyltransferase [Planctomycetia bacterium]
MASAALIIRACEPVVCCDTVWEQAYLRFESPEAERKKFRRRLQRLGAHSWLREARIVEIFCGRGNGLAALAELGFHALEGVDLSLRLLSQYEGDAKLYVADCRQLPFPDASRDLVIVQGGLHHLPCIPGDLAAVLAEVRRVLVPGGRFVIVEPWLTPFLRAVHALSRHPLVRRLSRKFAALDTMIEREQETYFNWLSMPDVILQALSGNFATERRRIAWGKLEYVGICD